MSRDRVDALRVLCAVCVSAALALTLCSSALGAGKAVNVGTPYESLGPAVAVDSAGNAVIAWANTKDLGGANNFIQYCVLPAGATGCSHSGNLIPADGAQYIDGVQVLSDGGTLVILADVYGAAGNGATNYEPEQEWQSTDDGATWTLVNGGVSVTSGIIDADTEPLSAVILPGTGVLGYGWNTAAGPPTFNAFPLSSPPECSVATCPAGYATLEPNTNPDTVSNAGGQFAAQGGAAPGVLAVFNTLFTNGPLGCAQSFGTAFAYGAGDQAASNNYNVSPGQPNSAWRVPVSQADCNVEYPAVGGGPSGFGLLESNLANNTTIYHRFDQSTDSFDVAPVTVSGQGEQSPALSQDSSGGIYATYLSGGSGGPIGLSYSADGGKTFASASLNGDSGGGAGNVDSSVNAGGQGWAAWTDNGSVFAQSFQASDAISAASIGGSSSTSGSTVTIPITCASFPCTIVLTLTGPGTVVVHGARAGAARAKTTKLGKGTFTINGKGAHKETVHLSSTGRKYIAHRHGTIKISAGVIEKVEKHTISFSKTVRLNIKKKK